LAGTPDPMNHQHSPLDAALDVFVFIPLGIAVTAAEELPKLAARGRTEVSGRLTIARTVGQFAVAHGRREVERRFGQMGRPPAGRNGASSPEPAGSGDPAPGLRTVDAGGVAGDRWPQDPDDPVAAGPPEPVRTPTGEVATEVVGPEGADPTGDAASEAPGPEAADLAIPGYDSLSASQVVQRLDGLSGDELAAVAEYESAHRGRRTVLTRVSQLQGS
jgi:hypothetical protein